MGSASATVTGEKTASLNWSSFLWFAALLVVCYAPVLNVLWIEYTYNEDMGHGFFVPFLAGWIAWQKRDEVLAIPLSSNRWGLALIAYSALQLYLATVGAELFLARTAMMMSILGTILFLCGTAYVRALAFPLFLLWFMIPIPGIIYSAITLPLQLLASSIAAGVLNVVFDVPVLRDGNVLELANQRLSVVEACSGIRSLLSLSFLSLIYGYFFERKTWLRAALFFATVPIAIVANATRVTITGVLANIDPKYAEGMLHSASGWVIFMIALAILAGFHRLADSLYGRLHAVR